MSTYSMLGLFFVVVGYFKVTDIGGYNADPAQIVIL